MLFFQPALIHQLCLPFFQKAKYNSLGKKRTISVVVTVNVNADEFKGTVSTLVDSRNKSLVGFIEESLETIVV